ncbi:malate synthase [Micromonospora sonchi]|uniref:Malate synthase n=1 Tax=Micromonospora sonchi TaxID=1763543 RepID=A0A917TQY6_9ACTN|nr:malate synthase [Micromonospora sonchi]
MATDASVTIVGPAVVGSEDVLTPDALAFVADLHRRFHGDRDRLLTERVRRRTEIARTGRLDFLPETADVRAGTWQVAPAPADLRDRRVEITGPTDRKMTINALNSGAKVWLADFEDATAPTWTNVVAGQLNLTDAIERRIDFTSPEGKRYQLGDGPLPAIVVRPRGWHLDEQHLLVDGAPAVAGLVDFGLYFFHNARRLLAAGSGPYFYLPKLEGHREARLWNDVFRHAQEALGIPTGTIRATVLIETITAAFEMDEILYELREHASGLNAGRWDYLFSIIKTFRDAGSGFVLPERNSVTMTAPMMRSYTDLLVATCHRRGAVAMGGMAAFIPNRREPEITAAALAKVRADKEREAGDGFDGSWVAHPDLVPVCREVFDAVLGDRPNQVERQRDDVKVTAEDLLDIAATPGSVTAAGLRNNIAVGLRYIEAWLRGTGAVAIFNLMEDAATAEISRSQVWQWVQTGTALDSGEVVTAERVRGLIAEEIDALRTELGAERFAASRYEAAREVFEEVALGATYVDFLTLPAYRLLAS